MPFDGNDEPTVADKMMEVFGPNGEHWIRGEIHDGKGGHCMLGALEVSTGGLRGDVVGRLELAVAKAQGLDRFDFAFSGIPGFNNYNPHGFAGVKRALEIFKADELAERRGKSTPPVGRLRMGWLSAPWNQF